MATNTTSTPDPEVCGHEAPVLGTRDCREDPLACHLVSALERAEDEAASYHLRQALQLRLAEEA